MTSDRTVLAVPGLGLTDEAWAPTLDRLAAPFADCGVLRLPGYGVPAEPGGSLDPASLAVRLLESLPPDGTWVLAGHSASCQVVAHAAALAAGRVEGLVLVGPTTDPRARTWTRLVRRWLATAAHEAPRQVPTLIRQYRTTGLRTMAAAMEAARRDSIERTLDQVSCPVLVLRGAHDRIAPRDWTERLTTPSGVRHRPPGAARRTATTLGAGGHMVPLTHGALVARAVMDYFD